ncbi:kif12 type kinesin [Raphidocelis subcapitata]|uniref:Kinesin-like protein n=1 Tax=Raphidocelis subcapitata TaxID=307507 RepID=A0A2V0NRE3_9CHLO|nr:kif12 type kinesin [Raphidocelis subcapitata]|eukprot:GBF90201.1 kif12 type kinesin [Raphidocelis subcapitata]
MSPVPPSPKPPAAPSPTPGARSPHMHAGSPEPGARSASGSGGAVPLTPTARSNLGKAPALQKTASDASIASTASALQRQQQPEATSSGGGGSGGDNIKVVVRVRPLFPGEAGKGAANVVQVAEDGGSMKVIVPGPGGASLSREFGFHACLGPDTSQAEVLELCGITQLLDAALAGYHVTIFAYGQTGSGKTHTMSGREEAIDDDAYSGADADDGIVTRSVRYLFHQAHTRKDAKYSLKASYVEIYNEGVYDLVHFNKKSLPVKWDAAYGFYVQGLKVVPCGQSRMMMEVIRTGMKHRRVGAHQLNMESSRSHSIMTVYCDATPTDPSSYDYGTVRYGKLSFVDLAGSERVKDSKSEGVMLKETININKSLSVLGKVISTLAENDAAGTTAHVPYRDSKLTKLLMDSLGGSALTLMIACCSPSSLQVEETLSTLLYATRAKNIQNRPTVQYDPREAQISLLRREIELLRQENTLLREQLRGGGGGAGAASRGSPPQPRAASPGGASPPARAPAGGSGGLEELAGADELLTELRTPSGSLLAPTAAMAQLRASLAGGAAAAGSAPASPSAAAAAAGGGGELLRRLRETQGLLLQFSEENGRLARENDRLRTGRNVLSTEHATVLDEIDLLRSKLAQLEASVLTAAGSPGSGGAAGDVPLTPSTAATLNMRSLLASLGLGGDAVAGSLPAIGAGGPLAGPFEAEAADAAGDLDSDAGSVASGFGSPMGSSRVSAAGGFEAGPPRRTSRSAPDGLAAAAAGGAGSRSLSASPARGAPSPLPRPPQQLLSPAGAAPGSVAAAARSLLSGGRAGGETPPGSGGSRGGGFEQQGPAAGGIYVADESKLAMLLGSGGGGGGGAPGALPLQPASPSPSRAAVAAAAAAAPALGSPKTVSFTGGGAGAGAAAAAALGLAPSPHSQRPLPAKPPAGAGGGGGGSGTNPPARIGAGSARPPAPGF